MLMNYHEMTMNEARNSPARRKQFLVICTVIVAGFLHAFLTSGGLTRVTIEEGTFPGGVFIYKYTHRDYAASESLGRSIEKDANISESDDMVDVLYSVYLDDPRWMGGRRQRFAVGALVNSKSSADIKQVKKKLLVKNKGLIPATAAEAEEMPAEKLWKRLDYKITNLPSTKAAVVQFPFTDGLVSALMLSYKVIPALRKYAQEHDSSSKTKNNPIVVVSTCSVPTQMCTHYAPLQNGKPFLLGQLDSETYLQEIGPEPWLDWEGMKQTLRQIIRTFPFGKYLVGSGDSGNEEKKDEL